MLKKLLITLISFISIIAYSKDIIVFEIDTGVDLSHKEIKSHSIKINGIDNIDSSGHGTHIAGLILKDTCPEVKLVSCKYYYQDWEFAYKTSTMCFQEAIELKVDYVNFSSGGEKPILKEKEAIENLIKSGAIVVVSAGNENENNPEYYPAKYGIKGMVVVGNLLSNGKKAKTSNYGFKDMVWEFGTSILSTLPNGDFGPMTGTSQATAIHTNRLLKEKCLKLK